MDGRQIIFFRKLAGETYVDILSLVNLGYLGTENRLSNMDQKPRYLITSIYS